MAIAKAPGGGDRRPPRRRAGVFLRCRSETDLMGEQTILCGMLQAGSLLCFDAGC